MLAQLAFFCDAIIRFEVIADGIFELSVPLGKQQVYNIQTVATWRKLHGLSDLELVPVCFSVNLIQSAHELSVLCRNGLRKIQPSV